MQTASLVYMSVRRKLIVTSVATAAAFAAGWFLVPKLGELGHTWTRVSSGSPGWLLLAVGLEVLSFVGYVVLFRAVFVRGGSRIDWRESYQITMAGLAATRLLAAGGAGGVALTAWALRRSGMVGLRHRRAVGLVPCLRRGAADCRDRDGLLRRHARQHAAAPRRSRRR